jgi:hypothetical protein|tara:strand:- start:631 stop:1758 length:1128 start_codon:yes stop_codon:yes gene_type:complete
MQDAIYNQVNWSQNLANKPYEAYSLPTVAELSPMQQQAYTGISDSQGGYKQNFNKAQAGMEGMSTAGTSGALNTAQQQYLNPSANSLAGSNLNTGQNLFGQAGNLDIVGAGQGFINQAGQSSVSDVNQYMNPYQTNVMDALAQQGARNLSENLLPGVSDSFIKAGQFGSRNMGEFGSRALRDTQESILRQQAPLAQQGYTQAMQASASDKARQAGLAGTVGQLTNQQMSQLGNLATSQTSAGQQQQQLGLSAANALQATENQDLQRQMSALQSMADMSVADQAANYRDLSALEAAGQGEQMQMQKELTAAEKEFRDQQLYPQRQLDWLSTQVRGMAPITDRKTLTSGTTTGATYNLSPLSQLAAGYGTYKGLTAP